MERLILIIAIISSVVAGSTLYSCTIDNKKKDNGYTTDDFVKHAALKKKYKNQHKM